MKLNPVQTILIRKPFRGAKYKHRQPVIFLDRKGAPVNGWIDGRRDDYGIYCVQHTATHTTTFLHEEEIFPFVAPVEPAQ